MTDETMMPKAYVHRDGYCDDCGAPLGDGHACLATWQRMIEGYPASERVFFPAYEVAPMLAALTASEAARRQAEEQTQAMRDDRDRWKRATMIWRDESFERGMCLRTLRARLPQPALDDLCDWQRDQIDAVLARPEPPADGLREAVNLALADLRAALSMNDDRWVEEILDHAADLLGAALAAAPVAEGRGAGEGEKQ